MNAYLEAYRRAFDFKGRSTRAEFWLFVLIGTIAVVVASLVDTLVLHASWLSTLVSLVQLVPSISVGVRRLHDTGRSGWWYFIALAPVIGLVMLVVFWCSKSRPAATAGASSRPKGRGGNRAARNAAAAGLGIMIAEAGEVAGAAAELVTAGADGGPGDDGDADGDADTDFDMD
jgi:uncharacterized membrane protein YhaH (DUF805 family)